VVAFGSATLGTNTIANPNAPIVGMVPTPDGQGYWVVAADGGIFTFGDAPYEGSTGGQTLNAPIVGMAATRDGGGYWLVAADGGIFTFGDAPYEGSTGGQTLNAPIVGMAATRDGGGYWLVAADGGIFTFGDAPYEGSTGGQTLNAPIIGMAADADGAGYWLVASDGGVFKFGRAPFLGSAGSFGLHSPVVGLTATPDGLGYWLVAADGGVFAFGDAPFLGSAGGQALNAPVVGMAAKAGGLGYWLVGADGGIFTFGDAGYLGSEGGGALTAPVLGLAGTPDGAGYWIIVGSSPLGGGVPTFVASRADTVTAAVYDLGSGRTYVLNAGLREAEASIMKVDIMATLFSQLGDAAIPASSQGLLVPMIEQSDNTAATELFADVGGAAGVSAFDRSIGMASTTPAVAWGLTTTTAQDQLDLLRQYVLPSALPATDRQYGLSLMEHVTPSQAWGVTAGLPPGVSVAVKNGWLPLSGNGDWQVNSIGWVVGDGRDYLLAVLTTGNPSESYGIDTIEGISGMVFSASQ
jgi:hypothetical protein